VKVRPWWRRNQRRARAGSTPSARRSPARSRTSSLASTRASSASTHAGGDPSVASGAHRLHGRYPANIASRVVAKYSTFDGRGLRAAQDGRQKIPVVRTPVQKTPS
jgi:hypothetical protein